MLIVNGRPQLEMRTRISIISNSNLSINKNLNDPFIFLLYVILSCEMNQLYCRFIELMYFDDKAFYIQIITYFLFITKRNFK